MPTYGLEQVGLRREQRGDISAELLVQGTSTVELRWQRADGRRLASAPKVVREQHGELLKELTQAAADIKKMSPPQRDRIEQLYLQQRRLPLASWRERYLDHPLCRYAGATADLELRCVRAARGWYLARWPDRRQRWAADRVARR